MMEIQHLKLQYLDDIVKLAEQSSEYLVPNTRMIYYLACTIFSKYSFVAMKEIVPVGYLFSMPNIDEQFVWLHQIAVDPAERRNGIGSRLIEKFEESISLESRFDAVRCAIKPNNALSKALFSKHGYHSLALDAYINMEIFEKRL